MLSFQKLEVYRCAKWPLKSREDTPNSVTSCGALLSVPLNIAEAAGRSSEADAARHYAIARGSAVECAAVLDVAHALGSLQESQRRQALELLARVVAMLTKLCR